MPLDGARLFHINVNCSDLGSARRFYVEGLGLSEGARTTPAEPQPGTAFGMDQVQWDASILVGAAGFDGGAIDLLEWQVPAPVGRPPAALDQPGFQRIGVSVIDLDQTCAAVAATGGTVWGEPIVHHHAGGEVRLAMVSDPDGTVIEVMERGGPRLGLVAVTCARLDRSVAFYTDLGFREAHRFPSQGDDGAHLRLPGPYVMEEVVLVAPGGGDVILVLVGFPDRPVPRPAESVRTGEAGDGDGHGHARPLHALGMARLAALVPDLTAAATTFDALGLGPISPPTPMTMGPGLPDLSVMCVRGPDGEVLELIETPTA